MLTFPLCLVVWLISAACTVAQELTLYLLKTKQRSVSLAEWFSGSALKLSATCCRDPGIHSVVLVTRTPQSLPGLLSLGLS